MTSTAGARPSPSLLTTSRMEITALITEASWIRICFCWWGGKTEMTRLTVSVASRVCSVDNTRWPVSAAVSAVSMVS